ncbi:MAG: hypothetical protein KF901_09240 [Myxococcales bacterium]|nr:hypothetical protein [Myxococcales bacterium]
MARIGDMLVAAGFVTDEQVSSALDAQRSSGRRLGEELVALGFVSEVQLTQVLSNQLSVPWVSLHHVELTRELLDLVPAEVADRFGLIPVYRRVVRREGETLFVAMDDPTHEGALREVARCSGLPAKPMVAPPTDIRNAIRVYYLGLPPLAPPPPRVPAQPAAERPVVSVEGGGDAASARPRGAAAPTSDERQAGAGRTTSGGEASERSSERAATPLGAEVSAATSAASEASSTETAAARGVSPAVASDEAPTAEARAAAREASPAPANDEAAEAAPDASARATESAAPADTTATATKSAAPAASAPAESAPAERAPAGKFVTLTLLDGTTVRLPSPRGRRAAAASAEPPRPSGLTGSDLVRALLAKGQGADVGDVLEDVQWEVLFATLLQLALKKGLIADWEFVEAYQKNRGK